MLRVIEIAPDEYVLQRAVSFDEGEQGKGQQMDLTLEEMRALPELLRLFLYGE